MYQRNSSNTLDFFADTVCTAASFRCPLETCGREFTSKRNLVDHLRGHHQGTKPHACMFPGCGKSFLRPAHLQIHTRIHTGEKPFECPFQGCGKKWNQKSALKQHIRSHTGEKPFRCTYQGCGKTFSTSSSCKRHIQTHPKVEDEKPVRVMDSLVNMKKRKSFEVADYSNIRIDDHCKISRVQGLSSPCAKSPSFSRSVVSLAMERSLYTPRSPRHDEEEGYWSSSSDCPESGCEYDASEGESIPSSPVIGLTDSVGKMGINFLLN